MGSSILTPNPKENSMNREFQASSNLIRSASVVAALVVTVMIGLFIDTLADHYASDGIRVAQAATPPAVQVASGQARIVLAN